MTKKNRPARLSRRRFLGASAAALWLPWVPSARWISPAAATTRASSPNLLIITWPCGLEQPWAAEGSETSFSLSPTLAPFEPFVDRMTLLEGIRGGSDNPILTHSEGTISLWTGSNNFGEGLKGLSRLPSVDQVVAERIGQGTPYRSLHFGVQTNTYSFINQPYVHYSGPRQPVPAEDNPESLYDGLVELSAGDSAAGARLRRERQSVLDHLRDEFRAVRGELGADDTHKVDEHVEGLRQLERQLTGGAGSCGPPERVEVADEDVMKAEHFEAMLDLQTRLAGFTLQCGITRVATIQLSNTDCSLRVPALSERNVHASAHEGTHADRKAYSRYFVEKMASIIAHLDALPGAAPGASVLDETIVVMGSEMSVPGHGSIPTPFFLLDGTRQLFKQGAYVRFSEWTRHTRLLTSIARAFGLDEIEDTGEYPDEDARGSIDDAIRA